MKMRHEEILQLISCRSLGEQANLIFNYCYLVK